MELKPCLCPKNGARTLTKVTSKIWQCHRCGGVGSISEPEVNVPSVEEIYNVISEFPESIHFIAGKKKDMAQAIHTLLTSRKVEEPQWPKKVYTKKSFPSREDYRNGFNEATAACKQAWEDAQGKQ